MFGINGTEMVILVVVALVVIGPKRLPEYAQKLRDFVRQMRRMAEGAKDSVRRDFGDDFKDVDWQKLDPRQYDPRRIVREALVEEDAAIRESKRQERSSQESTSAESSSADVSTQTDTEVAPTREQSPIERFQAQVDLRDRSAAAPFDPEAT
ncbi:twin-arginine translocase TatA/TatE family subunit [Brevibacterium epidermidis]|uniref:twin-arginine translocase TatA/TatE family subunit n=1 Tax=Brevibacterium epidermidis TaxID=1698 RepID=UPI0007859C31|nr:twin-arginine translocase TatA/TatE family subunit [Brevibacterium epidermidis]